MTFEQLRHFVAAAETCNFSRAAERLFVSHSTISRSVAALEKELTVPLLLRNSRSVSCTDAGLSLMDGAVKLLYQAEELRDQVVRQGNRKTEQLHIASINIYSAQLFRIYHCFGAQYPHIKLEIEQRPPLQISDQLLAGKSDLGVSFSYTVPKNEDLICIAIEKGRFCVIVSALHSLAKRNSVSREELHLLDDVFRNDETDQGLLPALEPTNLPREAVDRREAALQSMQLQVKAGTSVAVVPEHAAAEFGKGCASIPISGTDIAYQVVLCYHRLNRNPALQRFLSLFRSEIGQE